MTRPTACITIGFWLSMAVLAPSLSAQPRAQAQPQGQPQAQEPSTQYVIGPEDVVDIAVWNNADISRTVPVRPDGKISLPLLNDVQAAGLTPMQLREVLIKLLTTYIPTPTLSVIVREVHSFKVTVLGEVKTPGRYEIKSRSTVLDVLAMAGGLTQYAVRGRIVILRDEGGKTHQVPFPLDKLTTKNDGKAAGQINLCVNPGDIIMVP